MTVKVRIIAALLAALMLLPLCACGRHFSDDAAAMANFLKYYDSPDEVQVTRLEKYTFENEAIYHVVWVYTDPDKASENQVLTVLDTNTRLAKRVYFQDMEYGFSRDVKALWDSREFDAKSHRVFTEKEIANIVLQATEYLEIVAEYRKTHPNSDLILF